MSQSWNDLLFAHWPIPACDLEPLLPSGLEVDACQGSGWLGIVPFWMDRVKLRWLPRVPGATRFPELNMRTYVRDSRTGTPGVYFFSLDAASLLAVSVARTVFQLPYYWSEMRMEPRSDREFSYYSSRRLSRNPVRFAARYRGLGPTRKLAQSRPGSIEYFLTERYCLFTHDPLGRLLRANIHHIPWPLEEAEADITVNELPDSIGLALPSTTPLLHYSRRLAVYVWAAQLVSAPVTRPEAAIATLQPLPPD